MIKTKTIRKNSLQQTGKTKCKKSGHKQMRTKRFSRGKTMRGGSFRGMKVKPKGMGGTSAPNAKGKFFSSSLQKNSSIHSTMPVNKNVWNTQTQFHSIDKFRDLYSLKPKPNNFYTITEAIKKAEKYNTKFSNNNSKVARSKLSNARNSIQKMISARTQKLNSNQKPINSNTELQKLESKKFIMDTLLSARSIRQKLDEVKAGKFINPNRFHMSPSSYPRGNYLD